LLDRLASILVDLFDIKVLGFHPGRLIPGLNDRPAKSSGAVKRARNVHRDAARTCDTASGKIAHPKQ
jgi:hypothetical protein